MKKCVATIDYETIRMKSDTRLYFQLVNIDPGMKLDHVFDDSTGPNKRGGLKFRVGVPPKNQMKPIRFHSDRTVSEWRGGNDKTVIVGLDYEPMVRTTSGNDCIAVDPKIANDG
jgi:hypothetical protein